MRQMLKEDWVEIPEDGTCAQRLYLFRNMFSNHLLSNRLVVLRYDCSYVHSESKESFYQRCQRHSLEGFLPRRL